MSKLPTLNSTHASKGMRAYTQLWWLPLALVCTRAQERVINVCEWMAESHVSVRSSMLEHGQGARAHQEFKQHIHTRMHPLLPYGVDTTHGRMEACMSVCPHILITSHPENFVCLPFLVMLTGAPLGVGYGTHWTISVEGSMSYVASKTA